MPSTAVTLVIFVLAPLFVSVRPMEHGMEMLQLVKVSVIIGLVVDHMIFPVATCV